MILLKKNKSYIGHELFSSELKTKYNNIDVSYDAYTENHFNDILDDYGQRLTDLTSSISIDEIILYRNCARAANLWSSLNLNDIVEFYNTLCYIAEGI